MKIIVNLWFKNVFLSLLFLLSAKAKAGTSLEEVRAFEVFKANAEKGDARAQCGLGVCYDSGVGVAKDFTQAVIWFRKAAE